MAFLSRQRQDVKSKGRRRDLSQSLDDRLLAEAERLSDKALDDSSCPDAADSSLDVGNLSIKGSPFVGDNPYDADGIPVTSLSPLEKKAFEIFASRNFNNNRRLAWENYRAQLPEIRERLDDLEPGLASVAGRYISRFLHSAGGYAAEHASSAGRRLQKVCYSTASVSLAACKIGAKAALAVPLLVFYGEILPLFSYRFTKRIYASRSDHSKDGALVCNAISTVTEVVAALTFNRMFGSDPSLADVTAFFMLEGVFRMVSACFEKPLPSLVTAVPFYAGYGVYKGARWLGKNAYSAIGNACHGISGCAKKISSGIEHEKEEIRKTNIEKILDDYKPISDKPDKIPE